MKTHFKVTFFVHGVKPKDRFELNRCPMIQKKAKELTDSLNGAISFEPIVLPGNLPLTSEEYQHYTELLFNSIAPSTLSKMSKLIAPVLNTRPITQNELLQQLQSQFVLSFRSQVDQEFEVIALPGELCRPISETEHICTGTVHEVDAPTGIANVSTGVSPFVWSVNVVGGPYNYYVNCGILFTLGD